MPEGWQPRGVTPRARSGQRPRMPGCDAVEMAERSYPSLRSGVVARSSYPKPKARASGREDQSHIQEAVAAQAQVGIEELSHVEGQEGQQVRRYPLSKVRSNGCALLEQL